MERSPRRAGVHTRTGASMGQYHTLRSFVISLAIAIAITKSPASGFTIARDNLNFPDLETEESKQLKVRYDLKTFNKNETIYNNKTKEDSDSTIIAINNTNKQNYSEETVNEKPLIVNETADTRKKKTENNTIEISSDATIKKSTETSSYATTAPSASESESLETDSSQDLTTTSSPQTLFTTETKYSTVTNKIEERKIQKNETRSPEDQNYTGDMTSTATPGTHNENNNDANKNENKTNDFHNDINNADTVITTIADSESKVTTETHFSDQKADQTNTKEDSTIAKTDESLVASATTSAEPKIIIKNSNNNNVGTVITTIADSESKVTTETHFSDQKADQTNTKEDSTIVKTDESLVASTTASAEPKIIIKNNNNSNVGTVITTIADSESKVTTETHFSDQKADQTNTKEDSTIAKTDESLVASTTASAEPKIIIKNNNHNNVGTVITTIADSESKVTTETHFSDQKADQTNTKEDSTIAKTDESLVASTTASTEPKTDVILEKASTQMTPENSPTKSLTTNLYPATLPPWKKYTTIDRKRTSAEDTTTTDTDMALAETAQTRMNLEKVFTNTPITSLEKLRNDLIDAQESTTRQLETTTGIETIVSHASESVTNTSMTTTTTVLGTEIETEPTKLEIVSKRAGYKDNRETTTPKPEEATTTEFSPRVSTNNTETYSTMYETEVEVVKNKNGSVYESQSQLAEDAMKEELLREETLNDNEQNAKLFTHSKQGTVVDGVPEIVTYNSLSVKPIDQEKKKNNILYAVSPNYKPLKKIDVQPPKQFVRDPDDNSWRNESISSLGIVFKPKNASKSFTQVLKNKTETELGNMTDKDSKDDLPDLRVRLEKIAKVRQSKKKINKFGDTVYSDYEESSENTSPSREYTTTPMRPFTQPAPSQASTTEFDLTVNAISRERFDLFKTEKTSPLTTNKPSKFYNLAEYYDVTDEYDADYVNQHKIDLKKFTKAMRTKETFATQPPELLRTQPIIQYQPERKATLQYFPPTQKVIQKVNMNDYDTNFNRKVNMYTINKEPPKNVLTASFGTVAPIPTESYGPLNKVTMKPDYTPMYQNDNLDKNLYLTNQPRVSEPPHGGLVANDGNFNRASYVIKHYRDFINEAAKGGDDERSEEFMYTEAPVRGVTVNDLSKMGPRDSNQGEEEYEYDVKFRKDIMDRFVDNFNQNSERFKVDFPILYNSSVVHRQTPEHGRVASSSAFMKRLYEVNSRPASMLTRPYVPHSDKTVELSPAYELHYYVPDEEEKEEMEPRAVTPPPPYRYRFIDTRRVQVR